ncbi:MAG: PilZ domain-containing protein [Deltaproteobacteria bacterium]|nr:PilZ domain-containing protein [Deltaproteobacteria bacterium]
MEKVYVGRTNQVKIICPKCELEKNINVFKFKDTHKRLKVQCKCGEEFRLSLDFRKYYRKKVQLSGEYFIHEKNERDDILIIDISMTGTNFTTFKPHNFSKDDLVELKFNLDNPMKTEIHTTIKIKWVNDRNVGAQFNNPKLLEKDLGFYLRK